MKYPKLRQVQGGCLQTATVVLLVIQEPKLLLSQGLASPGCHGLEGWPVRGSEGVVKILTRDFAVAISAFRISGSYLELDDDPETTAGKKEENLSGGNTAKLAYLVI